MRKYLSLLSFGVLTAFPTLTYALDTEEAISLTKYRQNTLGIHPAVAHNGAYGVGVFAEHRLPLLRGRMSVTLPVQLVVGREVGTPNAIFLGTDGVPYIEIDSVRTPRIALMPGVRFYVGKRHRAVQYALGVSALLEGGRYGVVRDSIFSNKPAVHLEEYTTRYRAGAMITQAWTWAIKRRVQVGFETGLGAAFLSSVAAGRPGSRFLINGGFHVGYMID